MDIKTLDVKRMIELENLLANGCEFDNISDIEFYYLNLAKKMPLNDFLKQRQVYKMFLMNETKFNKKLMEKYSCTKEELFDRFYTVNKIRKYEKNKKISMRRNYYFLGEILWGMKEYFHNPKQFDYLKKFIEFDKERYDINKLKFSFTYNKTNQKRRLCLHSFIIGKDDKNNYIIGNCDILSRCPVDYYQVIYKATDGTNVFDDNVGLYIKQEMMKDFHEEVTRIMDKFNSIPDYTIDLGEFDGLECCDIDIIMGSFSFYARNNWGSYQDKKDERTFFISISDEYDEHDKIGFSFDSKDENIMDVLIKILTIKIPKKSLHIYHQQMIENSGVLDNPRQTILDITKTICTPTSFEKVYEIDNEFLEQKKLSKTLLR